MNLLQIVVSIFHTLKSKMEYFSKTREQLISICKDRNISGYSGLLKHEILLLVLEEHGGKPRFFTRTRDQLIAYCQTNGLRYYSGKTKDEILLLILEDHYNKIWEAEARARVRSTRG